MLLLRLRMDIKLTSFLLNLAFINYSFLSGLLSVNDHFIVNFRHLKKGFIMKIQVIKGHLTATNKKHIKALLDAGMLKGQVNRIEYYLNKVSENLYAVNIPSYEKSILLGKVEKINHVSEFKISK